MAFRFAAPAFAVIATRTTYGSTASPRSFSRRRRNASSFFPPRTRRSGPATVTIQAPGVEWNPTTTVVSLAFETPDPPLVPGKKGQLVVRARGTNLKLRIAVENRAPGILTFQRGDAQELVTSGGDPNVVSLQVEVISSGDYSFHARLLPVPDPAAAQRYLQAAAAFAPSDSAHDVAALARRLERHPRDAEIVRRNLKAIIAQTIPGDFRTLLASALSSL